MIKCLWFFSIPFEKHSTILVADRAKENKLLWNVVTVRGKCRKLNKQRRLDIEYQWVQQILALTQVFIHFVECLFRQNIGWVKALQYNLLYLISPRQSLYSLWFNRLRCKYLFTYFIIKLSSVSVLVAMKTEWLKGQWE